MKKLIISILLLLFSCTKHKTDANNEKSYYRVFTVHYNEDKNDHYINALFIDDYKGNIPDSINLKRIKYLHISRSLIKGNSNTIFDSVFDLRIHYSKFYDTTFNLNNFPQLKYLSLKDNRTEFIINDSLPIRNLLLGVYLDSSKNSYINANKLYALDSIMVECEECIVIIPQKKLKRIAIFTSKIDTFYNDSSFLER